MYIDIEVNKPTKDGLESGAWLMAAEFTRLKESRAQQYLMVDVAAAQGINVKELKDNWNDDPNKNSPVTGGVFVCDFNHDGVSDFLVTDAKLPRGYKLYQGDAKGQFKDVSRAVGLTAEHAYIASWVDLDGDGWEDLVLNSGQIFQNQKGRLLRSPARVITLPLAAFARRAPTPIKPLLITMATGCWISICSVRTHNLCKARGSMARWGTRQRSATA